MLTAGNEDINGWTRPTGHVDRVDGTPYAVAAVPQPETFAMLVAGFGLTGAVAQPRRQG